MISSREFAEWMVLDELYPFGETRQDHRFALLISTILNAFRGKGESAVEIKDYHLKYLIERREENEEESEAARCDRMKSGLMRAFGIDGDDSNAGG